MSDLRTELSPRRLAFAVVIAATLLPLTALAQVPARFYWKSLVGGNAVPVIDMSMSGNVNPLDPAQVVNPTAEIEADITIVGFAKLFKLGDRTLTVAYLQPMGRISGDVTVGLATFNDDTSGFGDPMVEVGLNLIGPKAIENIPDIIRYEPGFSLDLIVDLAIPVGQYDSNAALNLGMNRMYGRIGTPIVWQFGPWIPGQRTTLDIFPSVWLFGANDDFVGHTLETDPLIQVEAHLTHDLTSHLWVSLDTNYVNGDGSSIDGVSVGGLGNVALGFTLGYQLDDNLAFTFGHMETFDDEAPTDLRMGGTFLSLTYGWHPIIEGQKRLKGAE